MNRLAQAVAALAVVWLGIAQAPQALAGKADNVLNYASTKDVRDINPHLYAGEMAAQNMVFESLVRITPTGIEPHLAQSWEVSEDGRVYTFQLRPGVFFSDGEPFNAQAVKRNIDAILSNRTRHAWLELVRQIRDVEVVNEMTLRLHLNEPYYPTLTELALTRPFRFISPRDFMQGTTKDGVSGYSGTGPWMLAEHARNQHARFVRNPNYWGTAPALSGVEWQVIPDRQTLLLALQKGDIQLVFGADGDMLDADSMAALSGSKQLATLMSEPIASRAIVLNSSRPILRDVRVRRALQHAVDKAGIADGVFNGLETVAQTLLARNVPYADVPQAVYAWEPEQAQRLLDESGWTLAPGQRVRHKDGVPLSLVFSYNVSNAAEREIAELIQDNFQRIGVRLELLGEEKQVYLDRQRNGDFDMQYSLSWGTPYDPASFVSSFRIPAHADYQGQKGLPNKAAIDAMIDELLITADEARRQALYAELLGQLAEQAVYIPLTYSRVKVVHRRELEGVGFNPSQYEIPFERFYFK
ncbi:nickel ABC transporter, nickel/metallophore periplasmic binding protein [Lampropedia aestuarii]|uniref:Nickel ABC transporter, nickel/metallophore periplasmic binding protein n=1 Tax=Lampropedia aestuarii TaxID=2562762 RepID=A0A4S5BP77_9BURK|nr:nickel ABC transporter substrate-binding protein [Lampropedia aestuarii]MDH5856303.1 nickel ABC transporter substrate-binding protein [Lampropedia aestuarii]THJ34260.1 nickel ABC transporter, nickel/metallophore periplasmic binding protein [Lampropedia aestuarii]